MDANNDSGGGMMPTEQWVTNEIKALEQAHAELAAKVEQMISKACQDCAVCEGRGWSINVPSQSMYPCRWCGGSGKRSTIEIASLESPTPAPDPVCAGPKETDMCTCHHNYGSHWGIGGACLSYDCKCQSYNPTAEPEPAPLDPVRSIMKLVLQYGADTANAAVCYRHNKDKEADDHNEKAYMRTQEIEAAIRAYGRDGAR